MPVPMWLAFIFLAVIVGLLATAFDDLKVWVEGRVEEMMGANQDAVDQVVEQLGHAKFEILDAIDALEAKVAAGDPVDLSALKAAAQALDDIVPDPVVDVAVSAPAALE